MIHPPYRNLAVLVLLLTAGGAVHAQTACPTGVAPGSAQCGPSGQYAAPPPATPLGEWISRYGATASDIGGTGNIGVAERKSSRAEAEKEAIAQCMSLGSRACRVTLWYANQCASLAGPYAGGKPLAGLTSPGIGPDTEVSSRRASARCSQQNRGAACRIVYSSCSNPVFSRY